MTNKIICHICDRKFKDKDGETTSYPRCGADVRNINKEHVLITERGGLVAKGAIKGSFSGIVTLTNTRIVFVRDSSSSQVVGYLFGAIGALIAMALSSGGSRKPAFTVQRTDITSAVAGKRMLTKMVDVTTKDGSLYRYSLRKNNIEDWIESLNSPTAGRMPDTAAFN